MRYGSAVEANCTASRHEVDEQGRLLIVQASCLDQAQVCFKSLRLADPDSPKIRMQRVKQIVAFGRNDRARDGEHRGASLPGPCRSDVLKLLAYRHAAPVCRKILDPDAVNLHALGNACLNHDVARPKRLILD